MGGAQCERVDTRRGALSARVCAVRDTAGVASCSCEHAAREVQIERSHRVEIGD